MQLAAGHPTLLSEINNPGHSSSSTAPLITTAHCLSCGHCCCFWCGRAALQQLSTRLGSWWQVLCSAGAGRLPAAAAVGRVLASGWTRPAACCPLKQGQAAEPGLLHTIIQHRQSTHHQAEERYEANSYCGAYTALTIVARPPDPWVACHQDLSCMPSGFSRQLLLQYGFETVKMSTGH